MYKTQNSQGLDRYKYKIPTSTYRYIPTYVLIFTSLSLSPL